MKWLKIVGAVILVLWMAWVTWEIEFIAGVAVKTCEFAAAADERAKTGKSYPALCPGVPYVWPAPSKNLD